MSGEAVSSQIIHYAECLAEYLVEPSAETHLAFPSIFGKSILNSVLNRDKIHTLNEKIYQEGEMRR